jgi:heme/copper-type cytochrome/quinol oxidase subunit 2/mono/diheme cytochrome c family protein
MLQAILADSYFWLPKQASTVAKSTDDLFNAILWICVFFFVLVTVLLLALVIKYRHRPGVKRDPAVGHSMTLEMTWTIIPSIIVVFLYYYGFKQYMNLSIEPPNSYEVIATGRMWQWGFTYPNGYSDPELHVVVNTPVRVILESEDVIHSLFIPAFRVKKDVVPGRYNRLWFQATEADGAVYVARLSIDGQPADVAVDANGEALNADKNHTPYAIHVTFSQLSDPVKAALNASAGSVIPADQTVRSYTLLNARTIYMVSSGAGDVVIDSNATPAKNEVQFSALPGVVQAALTKMARGSTIPPTQAVEYFPDAVAYDIYCAGYCGTNHSTMRSRAIVHRSQADFDAWMGIANDPNRFPPVELGKRLYMTQGCAQCHSVDGSPVIGPTWKDLYGKSQPLTDGTTVIVDDAFIHGFLPNPLARMPVGFPPAMPPYPQLKPAQVNGIIAYMKTISKNAPPESMSPQSSLGVAATQPTTGPATAPSVTPEEKK